MSFGSKNVIITSDDEDSNDYDTSHITYHQMTEQDLRAIKSPESTFPATTPVTVSESIQDVTASPVKVKRTYQRRQKPTDGSATDSKPRRSAKLSSTSLDASSVPAQPVNSSLESVRFSYLQQELGLEREQHRQERMKFAATIEEQAKTINFLLQKCEMYQKTLVQLGVTI